MMKLGTTDLNLRIQTFAMELLGPYSQFEYQAAGAIDRGKWSHRMLGRAAWHDRGGDQRDPAQHHRRARVGLAQGRLAARLDQEHQMHEADAERQSAHRLGMLDRSLYPAIRGANSSGVPVTKPSIPSPF